MSSTPAAPAATGPRSRAEALTRRLGLEPFELLALLVLAGTSMAILAPLLAQGRTISGADGIFPPDQLQYFAWIRDAAHNGLVGNRFDLAPGPRAFLHPGYGLSALLHAVTGLSVPVSYLLIWKPVAIAITFVGCLLYVRRLLPAGGRRAAALVLALFSVMPAVAVVAWTGWGGSQAKYTFNFISGEMWTGQYLWGYLLTAVAVFLMPIVLLAVESWRERGGRGTLALAAVGSLLVMWIQPWQGATLLLIIAAVQAWRYRRSGERPRAALLLVFALGALPAIYYFVLSRADPAWRLASEANGPGAQAEWTWPWWAMVLVLLPLALPAALAYRLPARSWQEQALRVWPLAALVVYLLPAGTFPYHAFQGLALPLGILAVQGVASVWARPRPLLVVAALLLLTVPGFAHKVEIGAVNIHNGEYPYYITADEQRGLDWLQADARPGGVLATNYAGQLIPYRTGREVFVGALSWSPDYNDRRTAARHLFAGIMGPERARAFVVSTHARFLFSECRDLIDLEPRLRGLLQEVRRFGCATVYVLRERPGMTDAAGRPDA